MDVSKQELINALAKELKPLLKKPEWADFVKTGVHKERPPVDADWWYIRAGSVLLKVERLGPVGVSKLRTKYGGRKNRGAKPEKSYKGSGSIVRKLFQQLENVGLLKQANKAGYKGRVLTPKADSLIAQTAKKIGRAKPKARVTKKPKKEDKKVEVKNQETESRKDSEPTVELKEPKKEIKPAKQEEKQDTKN